MLTSFSLLCRYAVMTVGLCGVLLILGSCSDPTDDVLLDITILRQDSLMREAALMLHASETPDYRGAFEQHLASQRMFFAEMMGLDRIAMQSGWTQVQADSFLVIELGRVLADSAMLALLDTVRAVFPYDEPLAQRLTPSFKRLIYHFPDLELPQLCTHVSGYIPAQEMRQVDQILPTPRYFSFGLHYFMGPDFPYYSPTLPAYVKARFDPAYLELMAMLEIAEGIVAPVPPGRETFFVDEVVRAGIKQYFLQQMLPNTPDSVLLQYSAKQMAWANLYEERIYKELMDHLFTSDFEVKRDYLSDKPYTTTLSRESAPRLGEYLGWNIVSAYMDRNEETSLAALCEMTDYQKIFREAKYRP